MSFLNPVNEPVLRFKSTDAGAPQINYNSRVAGDVKAVLKACLVTGYGTKASAGWTAVNEVGNAVEFASPSAAMSDYRIGIDDAVASSTWYYQHQNVRVNPQYNSVTKSLTYIDNVNVNNGWQLLVSQRGFVFIEQLYHTGALGMVVRLTYFSQVKSALNNTLGANIMFFNVGQNAAITNPPNLYNSTYPHLMLGTYDKTFIITANPFMLGVAAYNLNISNVDIASAMYLAPQSKDAFLGEIPAILSKVVNNTADLFSITDVTINGRPALSVCGGHTHPSLEIVSQNARTYLIYLDYWGY